LKYLTITLALFATIIGVRGDTWDGSQDGLKKVRLSGWAALAIGVIAAVTSALQTYKQNELDVMSRVYPYAVIERAVAPLEDFIELLYCDVHGGMYLKDFHLEMALNPDSLKMLDGVNLQQPPVNVWSSAIRSNYAEYMCESVRESDKRLDIVLRRYGPFIDKEVFVLISSLKNTSLIRNFDTINCRLFGPSNKEGDGTLRFSLRTEALKKDDFRDLVRAIVNLKKHLNATLGGANNCIRADCGSRPAK